MNNEPNVLEMRKDVFAPNIDDKKNPIVMTVTFSPLDLPQDQSIAIHKGAAKLGLELVTQFCHQKRTKLPDGMYQHQFVFNLNQKYYELQDWCNRRVEQEKVEYAKLMDEYEAFKAYYEGIFDFITKNYATDGANEIKALYDAWVKNSGSAGERV